MEEEVGFVEKTYPKSPPPIHPLDLKYLQQARLENAAVMAKTHTEHQLFFGPGQIWQVDRPQQISYCSSAVSYVPHVITTGNRSPLHGV